MKPQLIIPEQVHNARVHNALPLLLATTTVLHCVYGVLGIICASLCLFSFSRSPLCEFDDCSAVRCSMFFV